LVAARASFVVPPIKKTNLILKNPNFQVATRLWEFLYAYGMNLDENENKDGLDTAGTSTIKEILDDSFLMQYFVLDSISQSKREQKDKLSKYAVVMLKQQVQRSISLLLNCGIKITDEQLLEMIADEIKKEKTKKTVGKEDIKKKFMSVMDEYLENTQSYL
jgi:DNA primase large subunit